MTNLTSFVKQLRNIMRQDAGINGDAQRLEQLIWILFLKIYDAKEADWEFESNFKSVIPEPYRWSNWAKNTKEALTGDELLDFVNTELFPTLKNLDIDASASERKRIVKNFFADANQYMKDGVLLRQVINTIDALEFDSYEELHAFGNIYETLLKELQAANAAGEFYTPRALTDFMAQMVNPKIGEKMADLACGTGGFITSWLKELNSKIDNSSASDREKVDNSIYGIEKKPFPYMLCITNMLLHDIDNPKIDHGNSLSKKNLLDYVEKDKFDVILMNPPYGGSETADIQQHFPNNLQSKETADLFMALIMYRLKKNGRVAVILPDGFLFGKDTAKLELKKKLLAEFNLHTIIRLPESVFAPYTSIATNILFFDNTGPTQSTWFYRLDIPKGQKKFSKTKPMKGEHLSEVKEWWFNRKEIPDGDNFKSRCFSVKELADNFGYNFDQCGYQKDQEEVRDPFDLIKQYQEERSSLNSDITQALNKILEVLERKD